jgi:hypothetical protein
VKSAIVLAAFLVGLGVHDSEPVLLGCGVVAMLVAFSLLP